MQEERKTIDLYNETFEVGSDVAYFLMVKTQVLLLPHNSQGKVARLYFPEGTTMEQVENREGTADSCFLVRFAGQSGAQFYRYQREFDGIPKTSAYKPFSGPRRWRR